MTRPAQTIDANLAGDRHAAVTLQPASVVLMWRRDAAWRRPVKPDDETAAARVHV
jgi:hypothetical protein